MKDLLAYHKLRLIHANQIINVFEDYNNKSLGEWQIVAGEWHPITVDSNADVSGGLSGDLAVDCIGSYAGGDIEREIELEEFGEITFGHYVQNEHLDGNPNLKFYIDDVLKLEVKGPTPWYTCAPIGITPGLHKLRFSYDPDGDLWGKKAVIDTFTISIGKDISCIISNYTPAKPIRNLAENKILRGNTQYQQMTKSDTEISFTATFSGRDFAHFMAISEDVFYFIDEWGICYRGIFPDDTEPSSIALNHVYTVELILKSDSQVGRGFC